MIIQKINFVFINLYKFLKKMIKNQLFSQKKKTFQLFLYGFNFQITKFLVFTNLFLYLF